MPYPSKIKTVVVESLGDELVIYDTKSKRVHSLNATALVWQLCDDQHSLAQLADAVRSKFNSPDAEALVELTLEELDEANLLSEHGANKTPSIHLTRRHVIAGATAVLVPVVISMVAPLPVAAQSGIPTNTPTHTATDNSTNTATGTATQTATSTTTGTATDTPTSTATSTTTDTPLTRLRAPQRGHPRRLLPALQPGRLRALKPAPQHPLI
jgi:hypothetical protein